MSISNERKEYLKKKQKERRIIIFAQVLILIVFLIIWEILAHYKVINTFLASSPSLIVKTLSSLVESNDLFTHIKVTLLETIISFSLASIGGLVIASILWWNERLAKIVDPYLTVINALPKVALGPLIIIWVGASTKSIIFMALLINLIVTFSTILNGFINTDKDKIKLFKVFGAAKKDIILKLIIPSSKVEIISSLKLNLSLSLIGVIMGEFLSCKKGIGYLILYGTQVFNLSLVMCGIFLLLLLSFIFYEIINLIDKKLAAR